MNNGEMRRWTATALLVAALSCAMLLRVRAGTTGFINGVVTDSQTRAPLAGARVEVTSPSQVASTVTDAHGAYAFVSLSPDTYTVTVTKDGYLTDAVTGVSVFADATQVVNVSLRAALKTIAHARSVAVSALVHPGTTSDLYSVNSAQQERAAALGGGGDLNSAYSAIASVPGAYVPTNQSGYNQAVHIRGGDAGEEGFEFDGIPVNRAFDNYPAGSASSLGQLELQVYTGASPADAEAQGLAGFINQVIKSGTYPGYADLDGTMGTPTFYHSLNLEVGGSNPDRTFNYYVGIGGFNQEHRYIDQFDGISYANEFGPPLGTCPSSPPLPPSCYTNGVPNLSSGETPGYILGPMPFGLEADGVQDRSTVINFHIAIPHNGLRDDIQLLYDDDSIQTPLYVSPNDELPINYNASTLGPPLYSDAFQYRGGLGQPFTDANVSQDIPYYFPSSPTDRPMFAPLPLAANDVQYNNQAIVKLQYQRALSSNAFVRLYGYTFYSDYVGTGPASSWQNYVGYDSGDYELNSHTRGLSASFVDQLSFEHVISFQASYVTSTSLRMNNLTMFNEIPYGGLTDNFAILVNPNALHSGTCYSIYSPAGTVLGGGAATPTSCGTGSVVPVEQQATFASLFASYEGVPSDANGDSLSSSTLAGYTCGGGPCELYTVENGLYGAFNTVTPVFTGYAITDEWRPSDRWLINLGARLDQYQYIGGNTTGSPARTFWFDAFNKDTCFDTSTLTLYDKSKLEAAAGIPTFTAAMPCSAFGSVYQPAALYNTPSQVFTYDELQPRIGATYTINSDTVLRASFGKYIEQPSAAYEQYDDLGQDLPDLLTTFYALGFNTPGHEVRPPVSYNSDFSIEHHFPGTQLSLKLTPFLRQTRDEIENFYLSIKEGFISGLNAGMQSSRGFELAIQDGDFNSQGWAAQLGFAYTYETVRFNVLPNGTTILSPINADIATYNAYTRACAPGGAYVGKKQFGQSLCGTTTSGVADAPCYSGGTPDPTCSMSGTVANPYWNAPGQPLLNPGGSYLPYSVIPGGVGTSVNAFNYPYVATLLLQYRFHKLAILPSLQFVAGNRYGAPETTPGIDPASCTGALATSPSKDPRYPYGAPGGNAFDSSMCAASLVIPDPYTKQFDGLGVFRGPSQIIAHLRLSYDISPMLTATVTLANLFADCFDGQQTAFTYFWNRNVCSYGPVEGGYVSPVGNAYNPGDNVQTVLRYPYSPVFGTYNDITSSTINPFNAYFELKIKI